MQPETPPTPPTPKLVEGRSCGECAMCCKLLKIDDLQKPASQWCVHCSTRQGCDAYETRPRQCRQFFCHFLENAKLGEEWRPSKSRILLMGKDGGHTLLAVVDPTRPDAWKREPYFTNLKHWGTLLRVVVNVGRHQWVIHPDHIQDLGEMPDA